MVTVEQIKDLRDATGVSIAECKKALEAAGGDMAKAKKALAAAGAGMMAKKASRNLGAGMVGTYSHTGGAMGALVLLACETDFVAKNPEFVALANDLAMQVAAFAPADVTELTAQPFVKNPALTVLNQIEAITQKFGERIEVTGFSRLAVGS
jgi:elongation factor Ts